MIDLYDSRKMKLYQLRAIKRYFVDLKKYVEKEIRDIDFKIRAVQNNRDYEINILCQGCRNGREKRMYCKMGIKQTVPLNRAKRCAHFNSEKNEKK